jgi:hypothetical protein
VEQELLTLPEHPSSLPVFSGARVTRSVVLCVGFVDRCLPLRLFLLAIVLPVILRFTDSDYPFGIFKIFLHSLRNRLEKFAFLPVSKASTNNLYIFRQCK